MYNTKIKEIVLLYNIKGHSYAPQLITIMLKMGIHAKVVNTEDYSRKIGELIGIPGNPSGNPPVVSPSNTIDEEMIVMHNFTESRLNQFLGELRKAGIRIPLKAIVTPHNSNWTSYELHAELAQEREAFQNMQNK